MKRSELDKKLHDLQVLELKIASYERVRRAIRELAEEFRDDIYALEALNAIDKCMFNWLKFMYLGRSRLKEEVEELTRHA